MLLTLIIALALAGGAVALTARGALLSRMRAGQSIGRIGAYGYADAAASPEAQQAALPKLAAKLGDILSRGLTDERRTDARKLLLAAGAWHTTPAAFLGYRAIAVIAAGGGVTWMLGAGGSPALAGLGGAYAAVVGWMAPQALLKSRARRRIERIELELPELIDLLVVTLEAGLGFNAALQRAAERMQGPLGDEIRLALREHNLGLNTEQALGNLLERCDAPAVRAFVRAVTQGESLGVSIGQVMRGLAGDLRARRRQIVEEKAQKAPIKLLFPLAFLILPALFVVVLFPGLYTIMDTLGGG